MKQAMADDRRLSHAPSGLADSASSPAGAGAADGIDYLNVVTGFALHRSKPRRM
ncbi:MAG: hypothetical protein H7210_12515 [Pyrinomonadaceae bacterium]|nr:hypothetical protein [Phycisphaerales bacterium]